MELQTKLLTLLRRGGVPVDWYEHILKESFETNTAAPIGDNLASSPGPGRSRTNDTTDAFSITGGQLVAGASVGLSDPSIRLGEDDGEGGVDEFRIVEGDSLFWDLELVDPTCDIYCALDSNTSGNPSSPASVFNNLEFSVYGLMYGAYESGRQKLLAIKLGDGIGTAIVLNGALMTVTNPITTLTRYVGIVPVGPGGAFKANEVSHLQMSPFYAGPDLAVLNTTEPQVADPAVSWSGDGTIRIQFLTDPPAAESPAIIQLRAGAGKGLNLRMNELGMSLFNDDTQITSDSVPLAIGEIVTIKLSGTEGRTYDNSVPSIITDALTPAAGEFRILDLSTTSFDATRIFDEDMTGVLSPDLWDVEITYEDLVTDGLIAEYRFDDGSGQVLTDYSGNGYHMQLGSDPGVDDDDPTWSSEGLVFAPDSYCVNDDAGLRPDAFTVTMVFAESEADSALQVLWSLWDAIPAVGLFARVSTPDTPYLTSAGGQSRTFDGTTLNDGNFRALTITNPGLSNADFFLSECWLNKIQLDVDADTSLGVPWGTKTTFHIGRMQDLYFTGIIAAALVYDRALTGDEIGQNIDYLTGLLAGRGVAIS